MSTTPVCACANDIGWEVEANWPVSAGQKVNGQKIYCVGGEPLVPPRPLFGVWGGGSEGRIDGGGVTHTFVSGGTIGSPTNITPSPFTAVPISIANTTAYQISLFMHCQLDMEILQGTGNDIYFIPKVTATGGMGGAVGPQFMSGGHGYDGRSFSYVFPWGFLAAGATATFTPNVAYYYKNGGPAALNGISAINLALRFWGGGS